MEVLTVQSPKKITTPAPQPSKSATRTITSTEGAANTHIGDLVRNARLISRFNRMQQIDTVTRLQRQHGNGEVARALSPMLQRVPVASGRRPSVEEENGEDATDLWNGLQYLVYAVSEGLDDKRDYEDPTADVQGNSRKQQALSAIHFGKHLTQPHLKLLEMLRTAFTLPFTGAPGAAAVALGLWQSLQGELSSALTYITKLLREEDPGDSDAKVFAITGVNVPQMQQALQDLGEKLFRGAAYSEAHHEALQQTEVADASLPLQVEHFKEASEEFEAAKKLAEKASTLVQKNVINEALRGPEFEGGVGATIFELVQSPGEIVETLEGLKEKGLIATSLTVADLVLKVQSAATNIFKFSFKLFQNYAEGAIKVAVEAGDAELAKHWWEASDWAGEHLEVIERVEKVAGWATIALSAAKVIDDIIDGKWGAALQEAGTTGAGLLADVAVKGSASASGEGGTLMASGGVAMIAGAVVTVAAEVEALHDAAAFLRDCEEANVRDAATSFVDVCADQRSMVQDFVADAKLYSDPAQAGERDIIERHLSSYVPLWLSTLRRLSGQLGEIRPARLGGQPALREALGTEALEILRNPSTWAGNWQAMAEQMRTIFAGANAMAKYTVEHYGKKEEGEPDKGDDAKSPESGAGEGAGAGSEAG